jgi:AmmeMemoRadiSam system protein B
VTNDIPHLEEHSIEVLLPFVKRAFPSASIVPILVSGPGSLVRTLSAGWTCLRPDRRFNPFVVSTNMCANLPPDAANAHADHFADLIAQGNPEPLLDELNGGTVSACGGALCAALMGTATLGIGTPVLIASAESSGRPDHDARRLVRYAAYAYY